MWYEYSIWKKIKAGLLFLTVGWMVWVVVKMVGTCCLHHQHFDITFHCGCCRCKVQDDGQWVTSGAGSGSGNGHDDTTKLQSPPLQSPHSSGKDELSSLQAIEALDNEDDEDLNHQYNLPPNLPHKDHKGHKGHKGAINDDNKLYIGGPSRDFGTDFFLTGGKMTHLSSRDMCIGLYFLAMLVVPSVGLIIATVYGNVTINEWQASSSELCGYVYVEMCFKILVIILPGYSRISTTIVPFILLPSSLLLAYPLLHTPLHVLLR